jgi:hypothetical protein
MCFSGLRVRHWDGELLLDDKLILLKGNTATALAQNRAVVRNMRATGDGSF